jgi:hypothetical protein
MPSELTSDTTTAEEDTTTAVDSPTPFVASLFGTSSASAVTTSPDGSVSGTVPVSSVAPVSGPQGLPSSAIFVPGATGTTSTASAAVNGPSLAGPVDQVIDATLGGALALPDGSLQLVVPAGVADTDFLLVSLTEVGPGSASGNLQVGSRTFAMTVVDSGGATVTNFGTPILVTATTAAQPAPALSGAGGARGSGGIAALDPASGRFAPITTDAQPGQVTGSLDRLARPAATGTPDASLTIASTTSNGGTSTASSGAARQQQQSQNRGSGSGSADPAQVLRALGLIP